MASITELCLICDVLASAPSHPGTPGREADCSKTRREKLEDEKFRHPLLYSESEASQDYMRPVSKGRGKKTGKNNSLFPLLFLNETIRELEFL